MDGDTMTKKEMELWYLAVVKAASEVRPGDTPEELEEWDFFFLWWARDLWLQAGRPMRSPWTTE